MSEGCRRLVSVLNSDPAANDARRETEPETRLVIRSAPSARRRQAGADTSVPTRSDPTVHGL